MKWLSCILGVLLSALPCWGAVVEVTPETIGSVRIAGGDEVVFGPGIYLGTIALPNSASGTQERPTVLRARTPGTVKVVGAKSPGDGIRIGSEGRYPDGCHWVTVEDLEVCWSKRDGIRVHGSNVVIRRCHIHHNDIRQVSPGEGEIKYSMGQGIGSWFQQDNTVEDCIIEYNGSSEYDHGIYLLGKRWTVRRCRLQYNAGIGIHGSQPTSELVIEHNVIAGNKTWGVYLEYEEGQLTGRIIDNVLIFNGKQPLALMHGGANPPTVRGNWIYGNAEPVLGVGGTMPVFRVTTQPSEE